MNHLSIQTHTSSYKVHRWFSVPITIHYLIRMDESADARRILTAVPQSDWRRPVGWPHSSWMATVKNDLPLHNLTFEDAIEMAWISRCGDYCQQAELRTDGACRIMMMMILTKFILQTLFCECNKGILLKWQNSYRCGNKIIYFVMIVHFKIARQCRQR